MSGTLAGLAARQVLATAAGAYAQEATPGPGFVEVTYIPAGAEYFASKNNSPSSGNYGFGTAVTFNINRYVGVEGELGAMIATTSNLQFGDLDSDIKSPNFLSYTANAVVSPWTGHRIVPYGTGGLGGLTMFERPQLGVVNDETFLAGKVGGGGKWNAPNNHWGLRGDYSFAGTRSKDAVRECFARSTPYSSP